MESTELTREAVPPGDSEQLVHQLTPRLNVRRNRTTSTILPALRVGCGRGTFGTVRMKSTWVSRKSGVVMGKSGTATFSDPDSTSQVYGGKRGQIR